jgi:5-methylcytosine-specific restriction enzyme subunit McrC
LIKAALLFVLERLRPYSQDSRALVRRANAAYIDMPAVIGSLRPADYEDCQTTLRASSLPATRYYYYRPLEIALLILSGRGVAPQEQGADILLGTFIINFEDLFEEYLRRVLQQRAPTQLIVRDGNREGKRGLFDGKADPPAQPDIVLAWQPTWRKAIAEVKYKERPDRGDINQAITYALCYGTDRAVLVHQYPLRGPKGLSLIGVIGGIRLEAYAFDLGAEDLEAEEKAFAETLFSIVRPSVLVGAA